MEAMGKDEAKNQMSSKAANKLEGKSKDKRNLHLKRIGLIDQENWIHNTKSLSEFVSQQR